MGLDKEFVSRHRESITLVTFLGTASLLATASVQAELATYDAVVAWNYDRFYSGKGQCLDNTIFDPANGATISRKKIDNRSVITIVPAMPATENIPTALNFSVFFDGIYVGADILQAADHQTEGYIVNKCDKTQSPN